MSQLKIATCNLEWMVSVFGARWKDWMPGSIPDSFPGRWLGKIELEPIEDVPGLCARIAGVITDIDADIIGFQEGPPRKDQMELFVQRYLNDDYSVHISNSRWQTIGALVKKTIAEQVTAFHYDDEEVRFLRTPIPYYPWGGFAEDDQESHTFHRYPLVLQFAPDGGPELTLVVVHTKSKYSKLKTKEEWESRDPVAILDALNSRQKLSAEIWRLRKFLDTRLEPPHGNRAIAVLGDFNDGPFADLMEREFLIHNILDEFIGSVLKPTGYFTHAMTPAVLATASTASFPNPLENGQITHVLLDHILISPGIWQGTSGYHLQPGSCLVEQQAYDNHNDDDFQNRNRGLRPSDHKPISAILAY